MTDHLMRRITRAPERVVFWACFAVYIAFWTTLRHVPKGQHEVLAAAIRTAFAQSDHRAATAQWRQVTEWLRPRFPKLAVLLPGTQELSGVKS